MQGAHLSACHVVLLWPISCHMQQVLSPCSLGPRLSDPTLPCWAPYHPEPGFGHCFVLAIIHICFKEATVFSGTGHGDGAIRNSQQSSHTTRVISLNSMFTFATGFQSKKKKPSKRLVLTEKPTGRHPDFICMPNYPAHQLSCLLVHPHRRDVHTSPCDSSAHRDRAVSGFLW